MAAGASSTPGLLVTREAQLSKTSTVAQHVVTAEFEVFCGIDVARESHHAVALDRQGERLADRPLPNDEPDLVVLTREVG